DLKCVHGGDRRPHVAQRHHPAAGDIGGGAQGLGVDHAVVGGVRFVEHGEPGFVGGPIKVAGIDNNPAHGGAVAADIFGQGVHGNIGAALEDPAQKRGGNGVVHNQRDTVA